MTVPRTCVICGNPLPPAALADPHEPFCSTACARVRWGTELPVVKQPGRPRYREKPGSVSDESPAGIRYRQAWGTSRRTAA